MNPNTINTIVDLLFIATGSFVLFYPNVYFKLTTYWWRAMGAKFTPSSRTYALVRIGGGLAIFAGFSMLLAQYI